MTDQPTCGQGLAEHSALPAKLGELTAAMAQMLEVHQKALDLSDERSRKEQEAYLELTKDHRKVSTQLQTIAERMAGYRDLPMGRHDQKAMTAPIVSATFGRLVQLEQELLAMLQRQVAQDRQMLAAMGEAAPTR
jgi:hypothetical protein